MNNPITVPAAARLVKRHKVNVYAWIRKGYLRAEVRVTSPRQIRGLTFVDRTEVLECAKALEALHGVRS